MIIDSSPLGAGKFEFSYTGNYDFSGDPKGDWELVLKSSGTLAISSVKSRIDLFLLGGGGGGERGVPFQRAAYGGRAGEGKNVYNLRIRAGAHAVTIGGGGGPAAGGGGSSVFEQNVSGGAASAASGGASSIYAFGDTSRRYGGDGGLGGWSTGNYVLHYHGWGGLPYGADGGEVGNTAIGPATPGESAAANTGGGGGGGGSDTNNFGAIGGYGGSGIIIIRNAR